MVQRYLLPEMAELWSEETMYRSWLDVELAVAEAEAEEGIIPAEVPKKLSETIDRLDILSFIKRAKEIEKSVDHNVIAFLMALEEEMGELSRFVHYGLTSSDVVDTAQMLVLRQALNLILDKLEHVCLLLAEKAKSFKYQPIMGRTHGVFAEPTSLGLKFLGYYSEALRNMGRLETAIEHVSYGKISGAVGNYSFISPLVEQKALEKLGLKPEPVSTQIVPRDRHAFALSVVALVAEMIERFALELRLLQRTEVQEMFEPFGRAQRGSSAMPHKRNPIKSERLDGLTRVIRGAMLTSHENVALWHERDISHSSAERYILPDATSTLFFMLDQFIKILRGLEVRVERIDHNLIQFGDFYLSEPLLLALVQKGVMRSVAYKWVKEVAHNAFEKNLSFSEEAKKHPEIQKVLSEQEIDKALGHDYLRWVDEIFERFDL